MRKLSAAVLTMVLAGALLAGCAAPQGPAGEEATVELGDVESAVIAAAARVTSVGDPHRWRNGFGHGLELSIATDSGDAFSDADLDAVVAAIWSEIPWEPNALTLFAVVDGTRDPVDVRAGAARLAPLSATAAGQAGVTLTGMRERYGDWTAP